MKNALLIILSFVVTQGFSQYINTIAGNGVHSFSGDNGLAVEAGIDSPVDVVVDRWRNVYIADANNSRIRKIDTDGIITTVAGNGEIGFSGDGDLAVNAVLGRPCGITADSSGNIYFLDSDNFRIRKIDVAGIITTVAGTGTMGYTGDGGPATQATIGSGNGIASDQAGNIYIATFHFHVIRKIDHQTGIISTIAGTGVAGNFGDGGLAVNATFNYPNWVEVDHQGNIYVSDMNNNKIRKITTDGIIHNVAGSPFGVLGYDGDNGPATEALLHQPQDIAVDQYGNLFISDYDRIRRVNLEGKIITYAGNGTLGSSGDGWLATYANIGCRAGICVDQNSNLYIAESYTHRIRKVNAYLAETAENKSLEDNISVYPNPAKDQLTVENNSDEKCIFQLVDAQGTVIIEKDVPDQIQVDISTISSGMYFISLRNETSNSFKPISISH